MSDDEAMARMWQSYANVIWVHIFWMSGSRGARRPRDLAALRSRAPDEVVIFPEANLPRVRKRRVVTRQEVEAWSAAIAW